MKRSGNDRNDNRKPFRLAMVQMQVEGGLRKSNLSRAEARITTAAQNGAQVVLLPEAFTLGWTDPCSRAEAEPIPEGNSCQFLIDSARKHAVYLCAGLVERNQTNVYNSAVFISPEGQLLLHHRKINELEIGHACYDLGDRLQVARTPFGVFGLMVCADAFARGQVISRTLGLMGAEVILSPCAWAVPASHDNARDPYGKLWLDNYGPVAADFQIWIAGTSNVGYLTGGPWQGRQCIGCSLLVDPDGKQVLKGPYGPEADTILYADIVPVTRPAQGDGWEAHWGPSPL